MSSEERLGELHDKIEAGTMTHDDAADLFMLSMIGQSSGATRDEVLAKMRAHFQDRAALNSYLRSSLATVPRSWRPK